MEIDGYFFAKEANKIPFEVFISFKRNDTGGKGITCDYQLASDFHRTLTAKGVSVFFSERDLSGSAYVRELYQALDEAKILIVVGTRPEYVRSEWVRTEWETFLTAILSKRKPGAELFTYLEGMSVNQLPLELYNRHSFTSAQKNELVARVMGNLGKQPSRRRVFRRSTVLRHHHSHKRSGQDFNDSQNQIRHNEQKGAVDSCLESNGNRAGGICASHANRLGIC